MVKFWSSSSTTPVALIRNPGCVLKVRQIGKGIDGVGEGKVVCTNVSRVLRVVGGIYASVMCGLIARVFRPSLEYMDNNVVHQRQKTRAGVGKGYAQMNKLTMLLAMDWKARTPVPGGVIGPVWERMKRGREEAQCAMILTKECSHAVHVLWCVLEHAVTLRTVIH